MIGPNFMDDIDCDSFFDHIEDLLDFAGEDVDVEAGLGSTDCNTFPSLWPTQSESLPRSDSVFSANSAANLLTKLSVPRSVVAPCPTSSSHVISFTSTNIVKEVQEATRAEYSDLKSRTKSVESEDVEDSKTQSNLHSEVDGSIEEPKLGMVFTSDQDLFSYYKSYGKQCGFSVVTLRSRRGEDGKLEYVSIGCARAGKPRNQTPNVTRPRPTSKTDCKVKINVKCIEGVWKVVNVDNTHNHDLSLKKSRFFSCNREVSESVKRQLDTDDQADIRVNKNSSAIMQEAGGYEKLSFTEKDCHNYIDKARQLRLGKGGAETLNGYFERMQEKNDGFFSCMDLDDDLRLRNIFWADARSRASYKYFGDVVTFDATCLTNRFEMPFILFMGVNHHGQSILLGAGLLSSEDTATYTWLFKTWLRCMGGIAPKAIVTDQDKAIKKSIEDVFPNTRHRFCLWHILRKLPIKLEKKKTELNRDILKCIYDTQTIEEFEKCWENVINMYDVQDDPWLKAIYTERTFWVPVFLKDTFWAGMSTTQQSESMNAFFDGYINPKTNLKEFVDQFDNTLRRKIENETQADFHSFHSKIPLVSSLKIEEEFQRMYTNSRFREVQQQVLGMISCLSMEENNDGIVVTYRVEDEVFVDNFRKEVTYFVDFNLAVQEARCSCGLFETKGILCRHQLVIFKIQRVRSIPKKYILDRWRKDLKRTYTLIPSTYDVIENRAKVIRYARMMKVFIEVATNAASCDEHAQDIIDKLYAMNEVYCATKLTQHVQADTTADTTTGLSKLLNSLVKRGKGRPQTLKRKSLIENVCKKTNKKGKTKQSHGGDAQPVNTCRNLFSQNLVLGTQESIDGTQPNNRDVTQTDKATSTTKEVEVVEP